MVVIAKRKVGQSWRSALTARSEESGRSTDVPDRFDALVADGMPEAEAAYRALAAFDLLWPLDEPAAPSPSRPAGD